MLDFTLLARLADELDAAHAQAERLGVALCRNPDIIQHVAIELQSLDHIGQRCSTIARILRAADMHEERSLAGLESIRTKTQPETITARSPMVGEILAGNEEFWCNGDESTEKRSAGQ